MARTITIESTWRARQTFEVADDYEPPNESGFEFGDDIDGNDIGEGVDARGAEMVDWGIV
jgi:hypothetical protein